MAVGKINVLLLSNIGDDLGISNFRLGSYCSTLVPIAKSLLSTGRVSLKILANKEIESSISREYSGEDVLGSVVGVGFSSDIENIFIESHLVPVSKERFDKLQSLILTALDGWEPDIVLCWEMPSRLLRDIFPDACVLDLMPSMFMRAPYPSMISFDPFGIYDKSWMTMYKVARQPVSMLETFNDVRSLYLNHFNDIDVKGGIGSILYGAREKFWLLPFQVQGYFGWSGSSMYPTQIHFLEAALQQVPEDFSLVCTQYTGGHVQERFINSEYLEVLSHKYGKLFYRDYFEKLDSLSQYLIPFCDGLMSVSSSLGLQAKFFGKTLISPSMSHLNSVSDGFSIDEKVDRDQSCDRDFFAFYLGRTVFFKDRFINDGLYALSVLESFFSRRMASGLSRFPDYEDVGNTLECFVRYSKFDESAKRFNDYIEFLDSKNDDFKEFFFTDDLNGISFGKCSEDVRKIISFDVFDTLVCRTVMRPKDIFSIVGLRLKNYSDLSIPASLIENFSSVRVSAEKYLYDFLPDGAEEISVRDVYEKIVRDFSLDIRFVDLFTSLECDAEMQSFIARPQGLELFNSARSSGCEIIIVSDFIHSCDFVSLALSKCGYAGWNRLFVSSDVGLKKSTGSLYRFINSQYPNGTLFFHFGDNRHGDFDMAHSNGWCAGYIESIPTKAKRLCSLRGVDLRVIDSSIFLSSVLNIYAQKYLDDSSVSCVGRVDLVKSETEFGFLYLGPIIYCFSRWLFFEAVREGVSQIICFARDCVLPYRVLKNCFSKELDAAGISLIYIPVSRVSVSGLNIFNSFDLWSIRVDDYHKDSAVESLLCDRFLLLPGEIDKSYLAVIGLDDLSSLRVKDFSDVQLYELAVSSVNKFSNDYFARLDSKRSIFKKALISWGCDKSLKSMCVDVGYKGTITKCVQGVFDQPIISRFFMSYSDEVGSEPVENLRSYYKSACNKLINKRDPVVNYNLVIETLLNEDVGSCIAYRISDSGGCFPVWNSGVSKSHYDAIGRIHSGALYFAHSWSMHCSDLNESISVDPAEAIYYLSFALSDPGYYDAYIISPLVFDNEYSGHKNRKLLFSESGAARSIWPEGQRVLARRESSSRLSNFAGGIRDVAIRALVMRFCSKKLSRKFERNPKQFFIDSSSWFIRSIGYFLYR